MKSLENKIKKKLFKSVFREDTCLLTKTVSENFDDGLHENLDENIYINVHNEISEQLFYNVVLNMSR